MRAVLPTSNAFVLSVYSIVHVVNLAVIKWHLSMLANDLVQLLPCLLPGSLLLAWKDYEIIC